MQNLTLIGKALIVFGSGLVIGGFVILLARDIPLIHRLGKLPGDIRIQKEGFAFYFPITTCILTSVVLTLLSLVFRWVMKK